MTLFDRYVVRETLQVLLIGTLAIIGIFFGTAEFTNVLNLMNETGLPLHTVFSVMLLQLPTGLIFCMPAGVVVAVMLVLQRQNRDSEVVALQLQGIPLRRVLMPFLALGLISTSIAFAVSENLAPQSRDLSRRLVTLATRKADRPFANRSEIRLEKEKDKLSNIIVIAQGKGRTVEGFVDLDLSDKSMIKLIWAESARWGDYVWTLHNGRIFELFSSTNPGTQLKFTTMTVSDMLNAEDLLSDINKTTLDKTSSELRADIDMLKKAGIKVPAYLYFQYYRRFSYPLSCLLLVLAAAPMVLFNKRKRADFSMIYGGTVVLGFFLMQEISMALVVNGRIDPLLAAWLPVTALGSLGLSLTAILSRS